MIPMLPGHPHWGSGVMTCHRLTASEHRSYLVSFPTLSPPALTLPALTPCVASAEHSGFTVFLSQPVSLNSVPFKDRHAALPSLLLVEFLLNL